MASSPPASEHAVDASIRHIGAMFAMFDPFRFRAWAELGLTTAQLRVLFLVRNDPGVTAGELATRLSVTPPTISGIVDRLVKLTLIRREDDFALFCSARLNTSSVTCGTANALSSAVAVRSPN